MNNKTLLLLETVVLGQIMLENCETLIGTDYGKQRTKVALKNLIKELELLAERDYDKVFSLDESLTQSVGFELKKLAQKVANLDTQKKVLRSQFEEAIDIDALALQEAVHKIITREN